ncbi:MAG: hypothetical protein ACK42D_00050 [Candidatus Paceibacteria bacterium]
MYPNHHALLYIGRDSFDVSHFENEHESTHDIIVQRYDEFRINDARSLVSLATSTPTLKSRQYFIIIANSIATEAQNALLKLLEEPPSVSSFVFVLPQNILLPTLRSRFMIMSEVGHEVAYPTQFLEFVAEAIPDRLSRIASLIEKKNTAEFGLLREGLLHCLRQRRRVLSVAQLKRLHWLVSQMQLRGSSPKLLWEDVAFTLPVEVLSTT